MSNVSTEDVVNAFVGVPGHGGLDYKPIPAALRDVLVGMVQNVEEFVPQPPPFPAEPEAWVRPADWLEVAKPINEEQVFRGLFAIFPENPNYVALVANDAYIGRVTGVDIVEGSVGCVVGAFSKEYYGSTIAGTVDSVDESGAVTAVTITAGTAYVGFNFGDISIGESTFQLIVNAIQLNNYTVDWGDGTIEDFDGGVTAEHAYDYDLFDVDGATICSRGYKQAIITVTPQEGSDLTSFHTVGHSLDENNWPAWLDEVINGPELITFQANYGVDCKMLERVYLGENVVEDASSMFDSLMNLQTVEILKLLSSTSCDSMFYNNKNLRSIVLPNLPLCTTLYNAFYGCTALEKVVIGDCPLLEDGSYMFEGCSALKQARFGDLGLDSMSGSLLIDSMLYGCYSFTHFVCGSLISDNLAGAWFTDTSPIYIEFGDLLNDGTLDFNSMGADNPYLIEYIKIGNLPDVTSLASMCSDLEGLRIFEMGDVPLCEDFSSAWYACYVLTSWKAGDMSAALNISDAFSDGYGFVVKRLVLGNFPVCTDFSNLFNYSHGVEELVMGDIRGDADFTGFALDSVNLRKLTVGNILGSTFPTALFASAPALQEIEVGDGLEVEGDVSISNDSMQRLTMGSFPNAGICYSGGVATTEMNLSGVVPSGDMSGAFSNIKSLRIAPLFDLSRCNPDGIYGMFTNDMAMRSIPALDLSSATDLQQWVEGCTALSRCDAFGAKVDISFEGCNFGVDGLVNIFENLGTLEVGGLGDITAFYIGGNQSSYAHNAYNTLRVTGGGDGNAEVRFFLSTEGDISDVSIVNPGTGYTTPNHETDYSTTDITEGGSGVGLTASVDANYLLSQTITVTNNPGTPYLTPTQIAIAETKGWTVVVS